MGIKNYELRKVLIDFGKIEKEIFNSYLNYSETIKELWKFPERKHNMGNVEITVKVNGVETPLYRISEQTLLTVRENSKPEEIPVARTANYHNERRLILKISDSIKKRINESLEVIVIDLKTGRVTGSWLLENDQHYYNGANFYSNVKTIE